MSKKKVNGKKKINYKNIGIIIAIVLVITSLLIFKNNNQKENDSIVDKNDPYTFQDEDDEFSSYGDVVVEGYAILNFQDVDCGNDGPCTEDSIISIQDLVKFNITKVDSKKFQNALKEWDYSNDVIQLGCIKDDIITYTAAADEYGPSEYDENNKEAYLKTISLSKDVSKKILSSDMNHPIKLKLSKLKLTHKINKIGHCNSMINKIEVVE